MADVLAALGRVEETKAHCYAATTVHERVLRAPAKLARIPLRRISEPAVFYTPDNSPRSAGMPSPAGSRHNSALSLQHLAAVPHLECAAVCR